MFEQQAKDLAKKIAGARRIAIVGHKNPDFDSIGAVLGLGRIIEINFGARPICIYDGNIPDNMDFLPGRDSLVYAPKLPDDFRVDLLIVLDTADADKQFGDAREFIFSRAGEIVKIDHHANSLDFGDLNIHDESATATSEIIYDIAVANGWNIDRDAAACLLAGIISDTGQFAFVHNSHILRVAAELVDLGGDMEYLIENINHAPKKHIAAVCRAVANAEFFGDLAIAVIPRADYKNLDGSGTEVFDMLRRIPSVEYMALLTESHSDHTHVSFRGKTRAVNEIAMKYFNGGGHKLAAGGSFPGNVAEAKAAVKKAFGK